MNKLEKLRAALADKGIDALIVLDELNQRYLSDFAFTDGLLLISATRAELITDFRYYEMAVKNANPAFNVVTPENRGEYIGVILAECGCRTVGFEGRFVPYDTYNSYCKKYPSVEFVDIGTMIEDIREIKTSEEIATMQKAQDITDAAFAHILKVLTPNMTEIEVAAELEYVMRKAGAESVAFDTIAVSGDASALPHGTPRNCKLKPGFLTMDYGAKYNGYCSDMTRTVVIGKADADIKKLYDTVLRAQQAAIDYLREGADCGAADKVARDIIDSTPEYKGAFGHSLGHSVGLFIHESPRLSRVGAGHKMRVGEIYTVEPGIYLFGKYGCRIEDMVAIEPDGVYNFTHSPKELIEIL
ncbi:MAG: aminopeptidase P family protein [Clostridia bacterium]|nr:aminopeptidase P family protein [Clostridia bacterium]